jgi:hypothetical protein
MSEFDPYHKWLGIAPKDQPPNHYRLLGLQNYESDLEVVLGAVMRQSAHLKTFQLGQHAALTQKILNEVSAAKVCLLDPQRKAAYDDRLREDLEARGKPASSDASQGAVPMQPPPPKRTGVHRRKGPSIIGIIASGLAAVLVVLGVHTWSTRQVAKTDPQPAPVAPVTRNLVPANRNSGNAAQHSRWNNTSYNNTLSEV